jgi:hypothetical protein
MTRSVFRARSFSLLLLIARTIDESLIKLIISVTMRCRTRETEQRSGISAMTMITFFPDTRGDRSLSADYIMRSPSSFPANTYLHRAHFHCARSSGSNIRHGPLLYRLRAVPSRMGRNSISLLSLPLPPSASVSTHIRECVRLSLSFFCCFCMHPFRALWHVVNKSANAETFMQVLSYYLQMTIIFALSCPREL